MAKNMCQIAHIYFFTRIYYKYRAVIADTFNCISTCTQGSLYAKEIIDYILQSYARAGSPLIEEIKSLLLKSENFNETNE